MLTVEKERLEVSFMTQQQHSSHHRSHFSDDEMNDFESTFNRTNTTHFEDELILDTEESEDENETGRDIIAQLILPTLSTPSPSPKPEEPVEIETFQDIEKEDIENRDIIENREIIENKDIIESIDVEENLSILEPEDTAEITPDHEVASPIPTISINEEECINIEDDKDKVEEISIENELIDDQDQDDDNLNDSDDEDEDASENYTENNNSSIPIELEIHENDEDEEAVVPEQVILKPHFGLQNI